MKVGLGVLKIRLNKDKLDKCQNHATKTNSPGVLLPFLMCHLKAKNWPSKTICHSYFSWPYIYSQAQWFPSVHQFS